VSYRTWLRLSVVLSVAIAVLVLTGPPEPWLFLVDSALAVALVGFLLAWRRAQR